MLDINVVFIELGQSILKLSFFLTPLEIYNSVSEIYNSVHSGQFMFFFIFKSSVNWMSKL